MPSRTNFRGTDTTSAAPRNHRPARLFQQQVDKQIAGLRFTVIAGIGRFGVCGFDRYDFGLQLFELRKKGVETRLFWQFCQVQTGLTPFVATSDFNVADY